jgi:hypothetical protein
MQRLRPHHVGGERIDQRLQRRRGRTDPARQRRGFQVDARAGEDLGLAIERQMVVVLRHQDLGQKPGSGTAAGDRMLRRRSGDNRIASPARQLLANMADDPGLRRGRLLKRPGT